MTDPPAVPAGTGETPRHGLTKLDVAYHRCQSFIRELVAASRSRGPLPPDMEVLCRAASDYVTGFPLSAVSPALSPAQERQEIPIRLEFDFTNKMEAFGATVLDGEPVRQIFVNMAAILWCCAEHPELRWKVFTAETILHELLHVLQDALGRVVTEREVDEAIMRARGIDRGAIEDTAQEVDPLQSTTDRAEHAEAALLALREGLEQKIEQWREGAKQAERWAADSGAVHDGANAHAFRKERRIWTTCADELHALLAATLNPQGDQT